MRGQCGGGQQKLLWSEGSGNDIFKVIGGKLNIYISAAMYVYIDGSVRGGGWGVQNVKFKESTIKNNTG